MIIDHLEDNQVFESTKLVDHFLNPRNVGIIEGTSYQAIVGDPKCGDYIELYIKIDDEKLTDIKYLVYGCMGAIATSSALTEIAKNKTITEALKITDNDVISFLGGIPEHKKHCSLLGVLALQLALKKYIEVKSNEEGV
ncbi:MAG: hypothetical protein APF84_09750 [Gracilibacter sp. BRH_c7a]|nr:MAG: hypothetical protein APF84_09750 [Gracilibacter sp. BRH_c7a]